MAITVTLRAEDAALVDQMVNAGQYQSPTDVVSAGVRLAAEQAAARARFEAVIAAARADVAAGNWIDADEAFDWLEKKYSVA